MVVKHDWRALPVALLLTTAGLGSAHHSQTQNQIGPNILLISIDTLRADRIGAYGYKLALTPTLDALAKTGARFSTAIAHVPLTYPSHVSLLTGRYSTPLGIQVNGGPVLPSDVSTLAEQLKSAGYRTGAFVGSVILDGGLGIDQGFQVFDDDFPLVAEGSESVSTSELQRPAGEVVAAASKWIAAQPGAWFAWVHLYDPHLPYSAPEPFRKKLTGRPYDAEVAYADSMVGTLLAKVDRSRTLVVVTSDHGESLGEHGENDHGFFIYDATLKIPMIISGPGVTARTINEQVRLIDVAPTVLELAAVAGIDEADGTSLVPLLAGEPRANPPVALAESWYPRLHFGWSELRGVRVGEFLYIAAPKPELYDLRVDPAQVTNIIDRRATVAARLASELRALAANPKPSSSTAVDPETARRLQALGYVGSFASVTTGSGEDPKDRVATYVRYRDRLNQALAALHGGRPNVAIPLLQQLIKLNVRAFEGHLYLGTAYAASGKPNLALGEFEAALQLNPDVTIPRLEIAKLWSEQGALDRAQAEMRIVLEQEPRSSYAWYTLGVIQRKADQHREAFNAFREATQLNPRDGRAAANLASTALRLDEIAVAREQFERMVALNYRAAPAHYNLGLIAQRSGNQAAAEGHFKAAVAADPAFKPAADALRKLK